jgi:hypothetical protein
VGNSDFAIKSLIFCEKLVFDPHAETLDVFEDKSGKSSLEVIETTFGSFATSMRLWGGTYPLAIFS